MRMALFKRDKSGATSIEYALIAGFIGLVIITAATSIGTELVNIFGDATGGMQNRGG